ncbi:MAG: transporter [Nocardioidaceae bacterium]|nr:transporter [Nocardioidaceae bacterium]
MTSAAPAPEAESRAGRILVLVGIVVLAFNLRPSAVSVGPVLDEVRGGLGMSDTEAGILTSLPVLAFALFGGLAPRVARRVGAHRLTLVALLAVVVGLYSRSKVDGVLPFLALTLLALAGMASANVVIPSLVKLHFPTRVGLVTSIYSTALAVGLTSASVLTVPISEQYDGWRSGLEAWALLAAVAVVPWLFLVRHDRPDALATPGESIGLGRVARTRLGWYMALFFGLQSLQAYAVFGWMADVYRSAGFSAHDAGLLLGAVTGISIPLSFVIPSLAARMTDISRLVWALFICYPIGYGGLILAPRGGAWVWAVVIGIGLCMFPLVLTLIGLRARTPAGTAALSGFTQSVGYLLSVVGPFGVGVLHQASGGWTVPLLALTAASVPLLVVALAVSRPAYLEDQLT